MQDNKFKKAKIGIGHTAMETPKNHQSIIITPNLADEPLNTKTMENTDRNNINIIDFILAEQEKAKAEINSQIHDNKIVMDNQSFFTDNSPEGILDKSQFIKCVSRMSKFELLALEKLLVIMSENKKINTSAFAQTDKEGNEYYWIKVYGKNGTTEFKISVFPGLDKLMQGYLFNLYSVNANLNSLYSEAIIPAQ